MGGNTDVEEKKDQQKDAGQDNNQDTVSPEKEALMQEMDELDSPSSAPVSFDDVVSPDDNQQDGNTDDDVQSPSQESGAGDAVKDNAGEISESDNDTQKLREQIENLNKALRAERDEKKSIKSLEEKISALESLLPKPSGDGQIPNNQNSSSTQVDPEVKETIKAVLSETEAEKVRQSFLSSIQEAETRYGKDEYTQAVSGFFMPALDKDPELLKRYQSSRDPGAFAYEEGVKIRDNYVKSHVETALTKQKEQIFKELKENKLPVSLSSMGGGSPSRQAANSLQKEMDELDY